MVIQALLDDYSRAKHIKTICQHITLNQLSIVVDKTSASGAGIWGLSSSKLIKFNLATL